MEIQETGNLIIVAYIAMFILGIVIFLFHVYYNSVKRKMEMQEQIKTFKATVEAEEKQKEKIANNLHDEIIPLLTVVSRHLDKYDGAEDIRASELLDQSISGIKSVALDLIPKTLLNVGLIQALDQYIRQLNTSEYSDSEMENRTPYKEDVPFSKNDQVNIYRMCLEILNNLQKHSNYSYLRITIEAVGDFFLIEFAHDGKGVSNEEIKSFSNSTSGLGLKSLESRLLILNGTINYSTDSDSSSINLKIPFSL